MDEYDFDGGEDDFVYEAEPEFMAEIKAFERMGGNVMPFLQTYGENIAKHLKRLTPEDRFKALVVFSWQKYKEELDYDEYSPDVFINAIDKMVDIEYKNPRLFVISLYCISENTINNGRLKQLFQKVEKNPVLYARVKKEDIVRYARLWESLLKRR
jgi:hypothetical protein